jgi:hypothetical protein
MRRSMQDHWRRWAEANPKQSFLALFRPRKSYERPSRFSVQPASVTPANEVTNVPVEEPTLTLLDYARMTIQLEATPERADAIHRAYGLDRAKGEREARAWWRRLRADPVERARFDQIRMEVVAARSAPPTSFVPQTQASQPPAVQSMRSVPPPAPAPPAAPAAPAEPPIDLFTYSVLCVELDMDPARSEEIYRRTGLADHGARERAHGYWQERFAVDPRSRTEWFMQVDRLRRNWRKL